jgi:hypothetical protein
MCSIPTPKLKSEARLGEDDMMRWSNRHDRQTECRVQNQGVEIFMHDGRQYDTRFDIGQRDNVIPKSKPDWLQ